MQTSHISEKLSLRTKLFYGVGDMGNAIINTAIAFFLLLFYTDVALVPPALAGSALLIGKIWDAVNDPLFGWVSDRTHSRYGKRRVYMIFGALPMGIFASLLWMLPGGLNNVLSFAWIAGTFVLLDTFTTITSTPYYALTAELTHDYNERSSLTAYRMLFGVIAYMVGAAGTPFFVGLFPTERTGYLAVGIVYGAICTIVLWISAAGVKEKVEANKTIVETSPIASFITAMRNKPFQQLILAYLIAQLGFTLVQTLLAYFLTYQLGMEDAVPLVMLLLLGSVLIFLFPWKAIADRWNKGPAYGAGLAIAAVAVAATFLLPHHETPLIYVVAVVAGIGFSANWVFPWAMIPDVVEYDQVESSEARGGMYYGVWGFTSKLIAALAITISGWTLQLSGYIPNVEQSETTLLAIRICFALVPAAFFLFSVPFLVRYPITRQSHAKVLEKLQNKN